MKEGDIKLLGLDLWHERLRFFYCQASGKVKESGKSAGASENFGLGNLMTMMTKNY